VAFTDSPGLAADDPQATLLTQVQGVIAEYEKAKIAERYRRGKLFRARAGEIVTWKVSYGYRRIPRSPATGQAHHEVYEPEGPVVRRIFTDRAAGITVREICRRLNADGVSSPTGIPTWGHSTLSRLLRNQAYIGRVYYNRTESVPDRRPTRRNRQVPRERDEWIPIECPRIISDELFQAASRVATDNSKWSPRRAEPGQWLLKGLVKCGVCGVGTNCHKMRGRNGTWHRYYYCRNHDPLRAGGEQHRCPERNIRADALDTFVFDHIRAAITHPDQLLAGDQAVTLHTPVPDDELLATELARLDRKIDAADAERRRLVDLYQGGFIELPEMQRRATEVAARRKSCSTSEPASPTNEPSSPVTTNSTAASTISPPASTPSSTPSTTSRNNSCCAYSSKTSGSPAGTSRSGSASRWTRHHPTRRGRPAQQAHRHRSRTQCQPKTVCVPLVDVVGG
jgi:site-specific DNA recombinase